jgi:hypothetical protein
MADIFYVDDGYVDSSYFTYIADAAATPSSTATMEVNAGIVKEAQVDINPAFSPSMLVNVLKNHTAILDSTASFDVTANKTTDTGSLLEYFAQLDALADVTRDVVASLDSAFVFDIDLSGTQFANATLSAAFTQSVSAEITKEATASLTATSTIEAKITQIFEGIVLQASLGTMDISADRIREDTFTFDAIATSLITGEFVPQEASATLDSTASLSVSSEKIYALSSTQESTFTKTVSGDRIREATFTLPSIASSLVVGGEEQNAIVNLSSSFTQTTNTRRNRSNQLIANAVVTTTINPIEYQLKTFPYNRPNPLEFGTTSNGTSWSWSSTGSNTTIIDSGTTESLGYLGEQRYNLRMTGGNSNSSLRAVRSKNATITNITTIGSSDFIFTGQFRQTSGLTNYTIASIGGTDSIGTSGGIRIRIGSNGQMIVYSNGVGYDTNVSDFLSANMSFTLKRTNGNWSFGSHNGTRDPIFFNGTSLGDGKLYLFNYAAVGTGLTSSSNIQWKAVYLGINTDYPTPNNLDNTILYYDFENQLFTENTSIELFGSASLSSQFTLSAKLNYKTASASLQSSLGNLTTIIGAIYPRSANLSSEFTATINGMFKPQEAEAQLQTQATMSVSATAIRGFTTFNVSVFNQETTANIIRDVISSQVSNATLNATANIIKDIISTQSSVFALTARTGYLKSTSTSQASEFTESANAITYIRKTYPFGRPHSLQEIYWENNAYTVAEQAAVNLDYTNQQTGAACVQMDTASTTYFVGLKSDNLTVTQIPAGTDFCFEINMKYGTSIGYGNIAYIGSTPSNNLSPRSGETITGISINRTSTGYVQAKLYNGSNTLTLAPTNINWSNFTNQWVRIAVRRVGTTVELYWNNSLISTGSYNFNLSFSPYLYLFDPGSTTNTYFDNISLQIGSSNLNESGPTSVINTNPSTAIFNFDFENGYNDNTAGSTYYGTFQLNSFFTIDPVAVKSGYLVSLQSSLGTMEINTGIIQQGQLNLQSEFTSSITSEFKPQEAQVILSSNSVLTVFAIGNKPASATLSALAAQMVVAVKTYNSQEYLSSQFQTAITPNAIFVNSVTATAVASTSASGVRTRNTPVDLFAEATSNIFTGDSLFNAGEADLTAQANMLVNTSIIRKGQATLNVEAAELTATTRFAGLLLNDLVQATMVVDGVIKSGSIVNIDSQFALSTIIGTIEQNTVTISSEFILDADGTTNIIGNSSQIVEATATITSRKIARPQVTLSAFGSASMEIRLTKKGSINSNVVATMAITTKRIRSTSLTANSNASISTIGGVFVLGQFNLNATASIVVSGKFIHIEDYIYIVPREYREFVLHRESRDFVIANETRDYIIGE